MKKASLFLCVALISSSLVAETRSFQQNIVTASEYCEFLNAVAVVDAAPFYNEEMIFSSQGASILCLGKPGNYHYQVIEGRENSPMNGVNFFSEVSYCNWLQNGKQTGDQAQESIQSGSYSFKDGDISFSSVLKNGEATYFLTEDEENEITETGAFFASNNGDFSIESADIATFLSLSNKSPQDSSSSSGTIKAVIGGLVGAALLYQFHTSCLAGETEAASATDYDALGSYLDEPYTKDSRVSLSSESAELTPSPAKKLYDKAIKDLEQDVKNRQIGFFNYYQGEFFKLINDAAKRVQTIKETSSSEADPLSQELIMAFYHKLKAQNNDLCFTFDYFNSLTDRDLHFESFNYAFFKYKQLVESFQKDIDFLNSKKTGQEDFAAEGKLKRLQKAGNQSANSYQEELREYLSELKKHWSQPGVPEMIKEIEGLMNQPSGVLSESGESNESKNWQ